MLDYGIVGNCKTCALISKTGAVEWMCFPTFSSPSIFAKLLDEPRGGSLEIVPEGNYHITQRYLPHTAILETLFESEQSSFKVVDFFPRYRKLLSNKQKQLVKQNRLIRLIQKIKGSPLLKIAYNPQPNYALNPCGFSEDDGNLLCQAPAQEAISLISNIPYPAIRSSEMIELKQIKFLIIGSKEPAADFNVRKCTLLLGATKRYWEDFVETLTLPEKNRDAIIRSAITLKLLTYSETGAMVAAPTTSLPEQIGTDRTFDYRYCWVRDSVFAADALKKIGRNYEPKRLMEFIINRVLEDDYIQIMYGINGETRLQEKELVHLAGFKNSRPVRIGNAAYNQVQHDVYGEVLDMLYLYFVFYEFEKEMTDKYWRFVRYIVNQIRFNWEKKDSGIWEFRGMDNHYTYSKLMCYIGMDRAIKLAQHFGREHYVSSWLEFRDEIRGDILARGYNQELNSFTMYYGGKELDASLLQMAYYEFLDKTDPRIINTIKAIYTTLRQDCLVQRYTVQDDFGKSTSAFTICSFWLVDALYYIGEEQKARELYDLLLAKANHLGLFSEDIDMETGTLRGNFPQAYTHIALINSSILLSEWSIRRKKLEPLKKKSWF
ncbi:glycoside hydrolase family 15 protein [Candidatus Woesearchaeota archaeon]|nr:glycoside hydrolase family 15 protein [Candidatus Woesearchaeota archaeon]